MIPVKIPYPSLTPSASKCKIYDKKKNYQKKGKTYNKTFEKNFPSKLFLLLHIPDLEFLNYKDINLL
jgi:hypothetical protein